MTDIRILRATPATAHLLKKVAEDVFDDAVDPDKLAAYWPIPCGCWCSRWPERRSSGNAPPQSCGT